MCCEIESLSETALLLRFGDRIDAELNARARAAAARLASARLPGIEDIAPAYASVLLRFDPRQWPESAALKAALRASLRAAETVTTADPSTCIEIPVCYEGSHGPDLAEVAALTELTADEVVRRHAAAEYRVAMLGFAPGFAYLLGLDPRLAVPRRDTPRTRVPAGSVAIGGGQTGVYPADLPGGWRLIGRTPVRMFDPRRRPPALLASGARVRFVPIAAAQFAQWTQAQ